MMKLIKIDKKTGKLMVMVVVLAGLVGAITSGVILKYQVPSSEDRIKDFYETETAVHVSPHHLRKAMMKGDDNFVLVDLRSSQEYEREHITGAINIPAYKDSETSAYGDIERIVGEFKNLGKDKEVIVYCYSIPCMTGRKVGRMLAEQGIYVKHLGVGWNEWRYFWTQWNHEHEWEQTNVLDYVTSGSKPGKVKVESGPVPCPIEGDLGC